MENYFKIDKKWKLPWRVHYLYIDTGDYFADQLFILNKVPVKFGNEYIKKGYPYHVIFCSVNKSDEAKFLKSLSILPQKIAWNGHDDYGNFCKSIIDVMKESQNEYRTN